MSRTTAAPTQRIMYHYTDKEGYNAIRATVDWCFKANRPPPRDDEHPLGAYFSPLPPVTRTLSTRISLPTKKLEFVFMFLDSGDLVGMRGDRRDRIAFSRSNYIVTKDRQVYCGPSSNCPGHPIPSREFLS